MTGEKISHADYNARAFGHHPKRDAARVQEAARMAALRDIHIGYFTGTVTAGDLRMHVQGEKLHTAFDPHVDYDGNISHGAAMLDGVTAWANFCDASQPVEALLADLEQLVVAAWPFPHYSSTIILRDQYNKAGVMLALVAGSVFPQDKNPLQVKMVSTLRDRIQLLEGKVAAAGLCFLDAGNPLAIAARATARTGNIPAFDALEYDDGVATLCEVAALAGHPAFALHILLLSTDSDSEHVHLPKALKLVMGLKGGDHLRFEDENLDTLRALAAYRGVEGDIRPQNDEDYKWLFRHNRLDALRTLIDAGTIFDERLSVGLAMAMLYGNLEVVELFLKAAQENRLMICKYVTEGQKSKTAEELVHRWIEAAEEEKIYGRASGYETFSFQRDDHALLSMLQKYGITVKEERTGKPFYWLNYKDYVTSGKIPFPYIRYNLNHNLDGLNDTFYLQVLAALEIENYGAHTVQAQRLALKACLLFRTPDLLAQYLESVHVNRGVTPLHDVLQAINLDPSMLEQLKGGKGVRQTSQKLRRQMFTAWREAILACGSDMLKLMVHATLDNGFMPARNAAHGVYSVAQTRLAIGAKLFPENPELGAVAMSLGANVEYMAEAEKLIRAKLRAVEKAQAANDNDPDAYIPDIVIDGAVFGMPHARFRKMDYGDLRGPFIGALTECCQRINHDDGGQSVRHAYKTPHSWFYIVEDKEKKDDYGRNLILGHSQIWRGKGKGAQKKGEVLFENAERKGEVVPPEAWTKIFMTARQMILSDPASIAAGITRVNIGQSTKMPDLLAVKDAHGKPVFKAATRPIQPRGFDGYRESYDQYEAV